MRFIDEIVCNIAASPFISQEDKIRLQKMEVS